MKTGNPIKTMAVMVANRLDLAATEQAEQRGARLRHALEDFCAALKGDKRELMQRHHPELFTNDDEL